MSWVTLRDKIEDVFSFGVQKAQVLVTAEEAEVIRWAHALLVKITPAVAKAVKDAVIAAATTPGTGGARADAALAAALADLTAAGVPHDVNSIKGAIEIEVANLEQVAATTIQGM